jgi:hypothetical protein
LIAQERRLVIGLFAALVAVLVISSGLVLYIERPPAPSPHPTSPSPVAVDFLEQNLTFGHEWTVSFGTYVSSSNGSRIVFIVLPGSYSFSVQTYGFWASPSSGLLNVTERQVNETIIFEEAHYNATFIAVGLPSGAGWSVALGGQTQYPPSSSATFSVRPGNYSVETGQADYIYLINASSQWVREVIDLYEPTPSVFNLEVNNSNVIVDVDYTLGVVLNSSVLAAQVGGEAGWEENAEVTVNKSLILNYSFQGEGIPSGIANITADVMTPVEFTQFLATGNATEYVLSTGSVPKGEFSLSFPPGTQWYYVLEGPNMELGYSSAWSVWFV